ncbi:MAG: hypothetical protein OXG84_12860 [Chloroflexi bacterium]|nr:hypothetical protein [Chloroflexota bacterium]
MIGFKYRYCKVHMARYIGGDLSEAARRRVGRYIDECEDCHREYRRHREFALKLERSLPTLGRPNQQRLDQLWSSLERELQRPARNSMWLRDFASPHSLQFSYGLVMLAISIALLLPMLIGFHSSLAPVDLPRLPHSISVDRTPRTRAENRQIIFATAEPNCCGRGPMLQNTPAPDL